MVYQSKRDEIITHVMANIEIAHQKVMQTKTVKECDDAREIWFNAVIEGAKLLEKLR